MRHSLARSARVAAAAATGLALSASVLAAAPAHAAPADRAGDWLTDQLTDGLVVGEWGPDHGLSIDTALALDAVGGHRRAVRQIADAVAGQIESYASYSYESEGQTYYGDVAGATAKSLVLAQAVGREPTSFGGVDLVSRLESLTSDERGLRGRIFDTAQGEPDHQYANTLGQAHAARGLAEAGSSEARRAVRFLLRQQCSPGFFRLGFAPVDARGQDCDDARRADRRPDTDVTAVALLSLDSITGKHRTKRVRAAIKDARGWLRRHQQADGGFDGGPGSNPDLVVANSNSTGLAAWALGETGACKPARRAARWVKKVQVPRKVQGTSLAGEAGAIAYDRAGYRAAKSDGIQDASRDQWRRATAQAAPGLDFLRRRACR